MEFERALMSCAGGVDFYDLLVFLPSPKSRELIPSQLRDSRK
jgi:hypothetical protein